MAKPKKAPNKSGYYRASFVANENGKPRRIVVYGKSEREAANKLLQKRIEYEQGQLAVSGSTTFSSWASKWLETYKKPHVESNSYKRYETIIEKHLPLIADMPLKDVKPVHLQRILNAHEGKSHSNTKKIYLTMRQIFKQAIINGLIVRNPTEGLTLPKTTTGERRALTDEERNLFIKTAAEHRAGAWILAMLCCGLRKGETIPLTWSDIDFKRKSLTISRAVTFEGGRAVVKSTKTKSGNRTVPIPDVLLARLQALPRRNDSTLVFTPAQSGGMLTHNHTVKLWHSFMRKADILAGAKLKRNAIIEHAIDEHITPHMLRHTYATDLYRMGVDLKTAQYLLGHSDIRMTSDIYTHADEKKGMNILPLQNGLYLQNKEGNKRGTKYRYKCIESLGR